MSSNSQSPNPSNSPSEDPAWNDTTREELRECLRTRVLGEVRLSQSDHDDIIQTCREVYIADECPEDEWEMFVRFAEDEFKVAAAMHSKEQSTWPADTDCDRLDRVEAALRDRGILLWQASPCCDTCTCGDLGERIDEMERRYPGFRNRVRGYAFFIDQKMADMLAEDTHISIYLGYGWISPDESTAAPDVYKGNALGIAREVCDGFLEQKFTPDWDGDFSKKIGVSLDWKRRTLLQ